ncbi:alpha/beta fold hydrolase [Phytohalomonas tamaricis]|uniref:alpha/beta fold hydrolase n=1 Tax=Phytohalomonas tamaricis TaxID=2081032 RepID=UPI000D0B7B7C|nr:alpha/beta fold hydrolase [Phytohalomonas tamaricis]
MNERLILLPGWALGCPPLEPLINDLRTQAPWLDVECHAYPPLTTSNVSTWLATLDDALPDDVWLGGWSLGGMLATALAARRGSRARGLVALGVNASFVAQPRWVSAMVRETFDSFTSSFAHTPQATLKRFALLTAQGGHDGRHLGKRLFAALLNTPFDQASASLALLGKLELLDAIATITQPQCYLFGEHDMLVPATSRDAIAALLGSAGETHLIDDSGHGFPIERSAETAGLIVDFITRHRQVSNLPATGRP